jgi:class 3 adenylate cyclase
VGCAAAGELARFRGREVDTASDGFLAVFDGSGRAVRCASAAVRSVQSLGIEIRAGVHTGEVDLVAGSSLQFEDRGSRELKGVPDPWRVLALIDG